MHSDGRAPASWPTLPNELQLQVLELLLNFESPITAASHSGNSKRLLHFLLVNKHMASQARRIYQRHHFVLKYCWVRMPSAEGCLGNHAAYARDRILKHPKPRFCKDITLLDLRFGPETLLCEDLLEGPHSWAPLLRHREYLRLAHAQNASTAALEAKSARRIAWQASFTSLRHFKVVVDFSKIAHQVRYGRDKRGRIRISRVRDNSDAHEELIRLLGLMETAFPNIEKVDVEVRHWVCMGHTGRCYQEIGQALEAAFLGCASEYDF